MEQRRTFAGATIYVDCIGYKQIDVEDTLPSQRAWCKGCAATTSKAIAFANFNGRRGIVLECEKCHNRHVMYETMFTERYVGRNTEFGFIPPTFGKKRELPRGVKDKMDARRKQNRENLDTRMASLMGVPEERYKEIRAGWDAERAANSKRFDEEMEQRRMERKEEEVKNKSEERKQLIADGILVCSKKLKCLVDTRTNQPYEL